MIVNMIAIGLVRYGTTVHDKVLIEVQYLDSLWNSHIMAD